MFLNMSIQQYFMKKNYNKKSIFIEHDKQQLNKYYLFIINIINKIM